MCLLEDGRMTETCSNEMNSKKKPTILTLRRWKASLTLNWGRYATKQIPYSYKNTLQACRLSYIFLQEEDICGCSMCIYICTPDREVLKNIFLPLSPTRVYWISRKCFPMFRMASSGVKTSQEIFNPFIL
jgi:hypothetical protein